MFSILNVFCPDVRMTDESLRQIMSTKKIKLVSTVFEVNEIFS